VEAFVRDVMGDAGDEVAGALKPTLAMLNAKKP